MPPAANKRKRRGLGVSPKKKRKLQRTSKAEDGLEYGSSDDDSPAYLRKPTSREWEAMEGGKMFVTEEAQFRKGDDVILNAPWGEEENAWVAKILSIRVKETDDSREVWVLVQWYYSAHDLQDMQFHDFNVFGMSKYERLISERKELLHADCFKKVTHVFEYYDCDPDCMDIPTNAFFQRFSVNTADKQITPARRNCVCQVIYHPYVPHIDVAKAALRTFHKTSAMLHQPPARLEVAADVMHFCPKPECSQWFHEACLRHHYSIANTDDEYAGSRQLRLLSVDPDSSDPHPAFVKFLYHRPARGKMAMLNAGDTPTLFEVVKALSGGRFALPASLLDIAASSITRQANCGPSSTTGNMRDVVLARRLVYQELQGDHGWLRKLNDRLENVEHWAQCAEYYEHVWRALCSQRILASPYIPYWDRAASQRRENTQLDVTLACPTCSDKFPVLI